MANAVIIIPARLRSGRLPRKLLLDETGQPLICHTYKAASRASVSATYIATGDRAIEDAAIDRNCRVIRNSCQHSCGTSRAWEAANILERKQFRYLPITPDTIIVNVQGDEPEINHRDIENLIAMMDRNRCGSSGSDPGFQIGTLCTDLEVEDIADRNSVKVAISKSETSPLGHACWEADAFSRALIPNARRHIGVYAYRYSALRSLVTEAGLFPATNNLRQKVLRARRPLGDDHQNLEQIDWLHCGYRILVVEAENCHRSINTPEDYAAFVHRWNCQNPPGLRERKTGGRKRIAEDWDYCDD